MDTKERRTGSQTRVRRPARRPYRTRSGIRHTALAAKNELEKPEIAFKGAGPKKSWTVAPPPAGSPDPQDLSGSRAVSGASSVAMIVMIDSAMM